jgi:hypothetical protein
MATSEPLDLIERLQPGSLSRETVNGNPVLADYTFDISKAGALQLGTVGWPEHFVIGIENPLKPPMVTAPRMVLVIASP